MGLAKPSQGVAFYWAALIIVITGLMIFHIAWVAKEVATLLQLDLQQRGLFPLYLFSGTLLQGNADK